MATALEVAESNGTRSVDALVAAMNLLAQRVAENLDELTTHAVQAGAAHARRQRRTLT